MASTCVYKEIHPPTGVTHAVSGFFTHLPTENAFPDLIVARSTALDVFRVRCPSAGDAAAQNHNPQGYARLEVLARYPLAGVVESLAALRSRAPGVQRDTVLITFRDAKLSVLEWDIATHQLRTSSLHCFEGDAHLRDGKKVFHDPPRALGDPMGRFAAVLMYQHHVAIIPALELDQFALLGLSGAAAATQPAQAGRQGHHQEDEGVSGLGKAAALGNSYVLDLSQLGAGEGQAGRQQGGGGGGRGTAGAAGRSAGGGHRQSGGDLSGHGIQEVRDAVLLNGYTEPVLLVLHQARPTWPGRYREEKDSCSLAAVSLSVRRKRQALLWAAHGLPADALCLVAVPDRPAALLLCPSYIMYCQQSGQPIVAVSVSGVPGQPQPQLEFNPAVEPPHVTAARAARQYALNVAPEVLPSRVVSQRPFSRAPGVEADLRGARAAWLSPTLCLLSCTSGQQLLVTLRLDAPPDKRLQVTSLGSAPPASALVPLAPGLLFHGSWAGDSLLLKYELLEAQVEDGQDIGHCRKRQRLEAGDGPGTEGAGARPPRSHSSDAQGKDEDEEDDSEEDEDQQGEADPRAPPSPRVVMRVMDSLPGVGPVRDMLHVDTTAAHMSPQEQSETHSRGGPTVFAAVGSERTGALAVLRPGLVPDVITEVPLQGVTGLWAIHHRREELPPADEGGMMEEAAPGEGALLDPSTLKKEEGHGDGDNEPKHAYLLLSRHGKTTMVLETGEELREVTDKSPYTTNQPTVTAGNLFNLAGICQVTPRAVRLFDGPTPIQDLALEELLVLGPAPPSGIAQSSTTIMWAQVVDPFVLLRLSTGAAILLEGDELSMTLGLAGPSVGPLMGAPAAGPSALITACCLHRDETGWLGRLLAAAEGAAAGPPAGGGSAGGEQGGGQEATGVKQEEQQQQEEEEGKAGVVPEDGAAIELRPPDVGEGDDGPQQPGEHPAQGQGQGEVYVAVARRGGALEVWRVRDMRLVFEGSAPLGMGPPLLGCKGSSSDSGVAGAAPAAPGQAQAPGGGRGGAVFLDHPSTRVVEIRLESFQGPDPLPACERPVLVGLTAAGGLLAYHAFDRASTVGAAPPRPLKKEPGSSSSSRDIHSSSKEAEDDVDMPEAVEQEAGGGVSAAPCCLRLAFKRMTFEWSSHADPAVPANAPGAQAPRVVRYDSVAWASPEDGSSGPRQSGLFVCGSRPMWLLAARGTLVPHPMYANGPISALTPFHNVNCAHGFIVSAVSGSLKVCHLPYKERLDTHWALKKVRIPGCGTIHRLAYIKEAGGLLAAAVSRIVPARPRLPEEPGGDPHAVAAYAAAEAVALARGKEEGHEVRLLRISSLAPAPGARPLVCGPGEVVVALRMVSLALPPAPGTSSAGMAAPELTSLLAVGTAIMLGEDYPCLGRIYVYRIEQGSRVGDDGVSEPSWSSTLVTQRDVAGGVTHLLDLKGMLVASVGKTVELYSVRAQPQGLGLVKVGFFDLPLLITSVSLVKDFLLVGDVAKGACFIRYNESTRVLELLSRDFEWHDITATGFVINDKKLLFATADASGTLRQFEYVRSHPASWGGQRLVPGGALHVGHVVTKYVSFKMPSDDNTNRHALLMATHDGSFATWAPVWDAAAAGRLGALQAQLTTALNHTAGLNPRAFRRRYLRSPRPLGGGQHWGPQQAPADGRDPPPGSDPSLWAATGSVLLDGDLLYRFATLPRPQQTALAARLGAQGTSADTVLNDLAALSLATTCG